MFKWLTPKPEVSKVHAALTVLHLAQANPGTLSPAQEKVVVAAWELVGGYLGVR